jgi:cytochrome c553
VKRVFAFAARHPVIAVVTLMLVVAVGGLSIVVSGLIPITASAGHWPVTEWLLHFTMRRSVITHARLVSEPPQDLDSPALVMRGAGHFEAGCRPCHGAPGDSPPPIPHAMTPHPPALAPLIETWKARELFYIVKHGVKMTGMPAWPAQQRDDEVWAVVGFLRRLPRLTAVDYERLIRGGDSSLAEMSAATLPAAAPPDVVAERCARCHGIDGLGRGVGALPKLAGQRLEYLRRAMHAYLDGRRYSGIMEPVVSGLSPEARHAALLYYSSLPAPEPIPRSADDVERGEQIVFSGVPELNIPPCATCHVAEPVNQAYPRLRGQYPEYIAQQLTLLQQRRRGGSEFVHIMHTFVEQLTERHIEDVAAYFASTPPSSNR